MSGSDCLQKWIKDRVDVLAKHSFDTEPSGNIWGADRWLLASLLQKAVRRSEVRIARRAGYQLLATDPSRLWRRLMTVGLEDIGIGDVERAAEIIAIATLPGLRTRLGGNLRALDIALLRACQAVKDRTGDHFSALAREVTHEGHGLDFASRNALGAVLASPHLFWKRRLRAGTILSNWSDDPAAVRLEKFGFAGEIFHALDVPQCLIAAASTYVGRARDALPIFVPFAWCLWQGAGAEIKSRTHDLPEPEWVGEVPAYAFDPLHTRLGRRAIDLWLRSYLQRPAFDSRQLAIAIWNEEAAASSCSLDWALGTMFREEAEKADLLRRGLSEDRHSEIKAFIKEERSVLLCARRAAWEGMLREQPAQGQFGLEPVPCA